MEAVLLSRDAVMDIKPPGFSAAVESESFRHAFCHSNEDTTLDFDSVSEQWASSAGLRRLVPEY
jgi:hypothetical protein